MRKVELYDMHKDMTDMEYSLLHGIRILSNFSTHPQLVSKKSHDSLLQHTNEKVKRTCKDSGKSRTDSHLWKEENVRW